MEVYLDQGAPTARALPGPRRVIVPELASKVDVPVATMSTTLRLLGAFLLMSGCGAASAHDLDATFSAIQIQEAVIAHRLAEADACPSEGPCSAREELCEAATRVCALARTVQDEDALARCVLARRRCPGGG